jgi:molybdopterin-guanine dinucleotide biosynthesis protein A
VKTTGEGNGGVLVIAPHDITGVVLCGGEGRRMGGVEKPLLPLHGRPLAAHVLERLRPQVGPVIVSANRELKTYRAFGHPVVVDVIPGLGPLGGLASIAPHVTTPWLFCCPGDAPRLDGGLVARLASECDDARTAAYPHDGERPQYLFLLVRTAVCVSLTSYLEGGSRSVHGWMEEIGGRAVGMPELAKSFVNVNTTDALAKLKTDN